MEKKKFSCNIQITCAYSKDVFVWKNTTEIKFSKYDVKFCKTYAWDYASNLEKTLNVCYNLIKKFKIFLNLKYLQLLNI